MNEEGKRLKSCPFCDSADCSVRKEVDPKFADAEWFVACDTCGARSGTTSIKELAPRDWNIRHHESVRESMPTVGGGDAYVIQHKLAGWLAKREWGEHYEGYESSQAAMARDIMLFLRQQQTIAAPLPTQGEELGRLPDDGEVDEATRLILIDLMAEAAHPDLGADVDWLHELPPNQIWLKGMMAKSLSAIIPYIRSSLSTAQREAKRVEVLVDYARRLEEALRWYADEIRYARVHKAVDRYGEYLAGDVMFDQGRRARQALGDKPQQEKSDE